MQSVAMRRSGAMPKGVIYLETMPVSADREEDYHKWYNDTHLAEICSVDGIVGSPVRADGRNRPLHRHLRARL